MGLKDIFTHHQDDYLVFNKHLNTVNKHLLTTAQKKKMEK